MNRYPQNVREGAVADFKHGLGLGTVGRKYSVPKSAVRSFVASEELNTKGRADKLEAQHAPRPAEREIVAMANKGMKGSEIAKATRLPFRTAVAAAWRFGRPKGWPENYSPISA